MTVDEVRRSPMSVPVAWPNRIDYTEAIIEPRFVNDPDLKSAQVELKPQGFPLSWAGQFAVVFRLKINAKPYAVRCFTTAVKDHRERYAALHDTVRIAGGLNCLVDFAYIEKGILVNGNWYPLVKMKWAQGKPIDEHIAGLIARRDLVGLWQLADAWLEVIKELRRHRMAHNDLQHDNILVEGSRIILVDYDGFYVPALAGKPALELGIPHYQHPSRKANDFNETIDNFSALVIYLTLRALAVNPDLWQRYHQDKRLILGQEDYHNPDRSRPLQELLRIDNPEVHDLAKALVSACRGQVAEVPAMVCSKGHIINSSLHRLCPLCGNAIYGLQSCPRCRKSIPYRSSFCPECGKATGWSL